MGKQLFANDASSELSGVLPQGGTTLVCASGHGNRFPTPVGGDFFYVTLYTKDAYAVEQNVEVVKVTARSGDVMTIVRDIESMTGQVGGYAYDGSTSTVYIDLRWTAGCVSNMAQKGELAQVALSNDYADLPGLHDALASREPAITSGTTAQYWRGDKSWRDFFTDVRAATLTGLSTATNAVIEATDTVLAALGKLQAQISERVTGQASSVDGEVALFSGTGGKTVKRATGSGLAKLTSGVLSTATAGTDYVTPSGTETLTNKTLSGAILNDGYTEEIYALSGTTPALNPANGSIQTWTLSGNSSPTDSLSNGQSIFLGITASSYTVTWPSVTWNKVGGSGTAPTLTSSGVNWVVLWKVGGTLRGAFLGTA